MLATRIGDLVVETCGKGPGGAFFEGSLNTFTNNRPQVRMGDKCTTGPSLKGSTKRFTNNKPTTRIIDPVLCGQTIQGSLNTFIF